MRLPFRVERTTGGTKRSEPTTHQRERDASHEGATASKSPRPLRWWPTEGPAPPTPLLLSPHILKRAKCIMLA
eukprot:4166161-Amphidinium_carterae.1